MTDVKLSEIASGGAFNTSTDKVVTVRNGNTDVLTTLGSAATHAAGDFMQSANNLSDVANAGTARTNLGLGSAATQNTSAFLQPSNNLSDLNNAGTARTNLGLGSAATQSTATFAQVANNLSDLASASTARTNLGLGTAATHALTDFLQPSNNLSDISSVAASRANLGLNTAEVSINVGATVILPANTPTILVNGAGTISSFGTAASTLNPDYNIRFNDAVTLTNGSNLVCPNGADLVVAAGYYIRVRYLGSNIFTILDVFQFGAGGSGSLNPFGSITNGSLAVWHSSTSLSTGNLSGDITTSGSAVTSIATGAVTLAKMANNTANTLLGYDAGGVAHNIALNSNPNLVISAGTIGVNYTIFNVKDYGAKGDGSTNDNTAIAACIAACVASTSGVVVYFPQGVYVVTQQFTASLPNPSGNGGKSLYFKGDGAHVSLIQWTTASGGILVNFYSTAAYKGLIGAEGLTFQTLSTPGGTGLSFIETNNSINPGPKKQIYGCVFTGNNTGSYWTQCMLLDGVANITVLDSFFYGYQSGLTFDGTGILIQNSQTLHATNYIINSCLLSQLNVCIDMTSGIEGVQCQGATQFVGANYGVRWIENSGSATVPLLQVIGCDFACAIYGILTTNVAQNIIQGNLFYRYTNGGTGNNWSGTYIDNANTSGASDANIISDNTYLGFQSVATGTVNAIALVNCEDSLVLDNRIDNVDTGIWFQGPSSNNIARGNYVTNFTTHDVYDQGTANLAVGSLAGYYATVYMSANQTLTNNTAANASFGAALHDPLTLWNSSTRLTVPAGVSAIKLSASMAFGNIGTGGVRITATKNGTAFSSDAFIGQPVATGGIGTDYLTFTSGPIVVSPGDYFQLECFQNSGGNVDIAPTNAKNQKVSWFTMEIVG